MIISIMENRTIGTSVIISFMCQFFTCLAENSHWKFGDIPQLLASGPGKNNQNDKFFKQIFSDYHSDSKNAGSYPTILDLHEYISHFGLQRCFVLINMFQASDISLWEYPVILRYLEPAVIWLPISVFHYSSRKYQLIWKYQNFLNRTQFHTAMNGTITCSLSKFLVGGKPGKQWNAIPDLCVRINLNTFLSSAKPWNCQVDINVFPDEYVYVYAAKRNWEFSPDVYFPRNFMKSSAEDMYHRMSLPSLVPNIHALIVPEERLSKLNSATLRNWINNVIQINSRMNLLGHSASYDMFLVAAVTKSSRNTSLTEIFGVITEYHEVVIRLDDPDIHTLSMVAVQPDGLLRNLFRPKTVIANDQMVWMGTEEYNDKIQDFYQHPMVLCNDVEVNINGKNWLVAIDKYDSAIMLQIVNADVWISVFENFTIARLSTPDECADGNIVERSVADDGMQIKLLSVPCLDCVNLDYLLMSELDSLHLRFISCSEARHLGWLQFRAILSVFDNWVWLSIILSVFMVSFAIRLMQGEKYSVYSSITSATKIYLEQGNPFSGMIEKNHKLRLLLAAFLLMGVVVSNAYKNTNVYNMIAPRSPIPYEKIEELVEDNFVIYAPVTFNEIENEMDRFEVGVDHDETTLVDVLSVSDKNYTIPIYFFMSDEFPPGVFGHIRSHKESIQDFVTHVETQIPAIQNVDWQQEQLFWLEQYDFFSKLQDEVLLKSLQECRNIAVVLPESMCWKYRQKMRNLKSGHHVFIGKEQYAKMYNLYYFQGLIPGSVTLRVKTIHESGIWEWQNKLVESIFKGKAMINQKLILAAPNIQGNILIVFIIWLGGVAIAGIVRVIECGLHLNSR